MLSEDYNRGYKDGYNAGKGDLFKLQRKLDCKEGEIYVTAMNKFLENLKMISPEVYEQYIYTDFVELRRK